MLQLLSHISKQAAMLKGLQPMSFENAARLNKKFRLEWNYNSNHIEGNTLTYGETELLLVFGETKGSHEYREYEEMKGHDVALKMVQELAKDEERRLTEQFIKELNLLILKESFYKEAITEDGQRVQRKIQIGAYKSMPNSVLLQNGEIFHYASPAETPAKMNDLMEWYQKATANTTLHPVQVAAELHYRFVLIHPFDDGNGRISRLLMNYHLLKNDHPPVIIKSADKKNYLRALHEADTGNLPAFIEYIGEQLLWSYDISIKAAKGQNIDEPGDWEKEIDLLKKDTPSEMFVTVEKSKPALDILWQESLSRFFKNLAEALHKFDLLFVSSSVDILIDGYSVMSEAYNPGEIPESITSYIMPDGVLKYDLPENIKIQFKWRGYKHNGVNSFDTGFAVSVLFLPLKYSIDFNLDAISIADKLYTQHITEAEADLLIDEAGKDVLKDIKRKMEKMKN
jgi:Fic family protein